MRAWTSALLLAALLAAGCACGRSKVVEVGGCDAHAWCRVRLEDGTVTWRQYPVVGEEVPTCP